MVKLENFSIIVIFILMSITACESKSCTIYDIHRTYGRKYTKTFEKGEYRPEKAYDTFLIESTITKLTFKLIPWKLITDMSGILYANSLNAFNRFMNEKRPNDRAFFISFAAFQNEKFRPYLNKVIAAHFLPRKNLHIEISDDQINDEEFSKMYSPYSRSQDKELHKELQNLIERKAPPVVLNLFNKIVPSQSGTQNKEVRIYDPMGDQTVEILPMRIIGDEYQPEKVYFYTNSFPGMATAIFIVQDEKFIDILQNKEERDSFDKIAMQLTDRLFMTHLLLFGAFNLKLKEIKNIAELIVIHHGKSGHPQTDVFIIGGGMYMTLYQSKNSKLFEEVSFDTLIEYRNHICGIEPSKSIDLYAPTKQTEPTFKHFDVRTVNGIYTPDEHYRQVTYMDLMQGKDSMTLLVIDGDLYDFIRSTVEFHSGFFWLVELIEMNLNSNVIVMACRHFKKCDVHMVAKFLLSHAHNPQTFIAIMCYGIFCEKHQYGNVEFVELDMDSQLGTYLFAAEQSMLWKKP